MKDTICDNSRGGVRETKVRRGGGVEHNILGGVGNGDMATRHSSAMGNRPILRMLAILLISALAMAISLLLALISSCDPHSPSQSPTFRDTIATMLPCPPLFTLPLQTSVLWMTLTS